MTETIPNPEIISYSTNVFNGSYRTFKTLTEKMNSGKILDTPKGALLMSEKIDLNKLDSVENNKYGYVILKGNLIHTDILSFSNNQLLALCQNRNTGETFPLDLNGAEVYKVLQRHF